jgi:hypothetical protein
MSILLFIVFLVLKLTGVIGWSWWWITCPLWIEFALCILVGVYAIVYNSLFSLFFV